MVWYGAADGLVTSEGIIVRWRFTFERETVDSGLRIESNDGDHGDDHDDDHERMDRHLPFPILVGSTATLNALPKTTVPRRLKTHRLLGGQNAPPSSGQGRMFESSPARLQIDR
jgi:hypothetical protein